MNSNTNVSSCCIRLGTWYDPPKILALFIVSSSLSIYTFVYVLLSMTLCVCTYCYKWEELLSTYFSFLRLKITLAIFECLCILFWIVCVFDLRKILEELRSNNNKRFTKQKEKPTNLPIVNIYKQKLSCAYYLNCHYKIMTWHLLIFLCHLKILQKHYRT